MRTTTIFAQTHTSERTMSPTGLSTLIITPPSVVSGSRGRCIVFDRFLCFFVYFLVGWFVCLFLCQQDYEKTAGPICMKFSGKVWIDHGTTWLHFGSIPRNRATPQNGGGVCCASPYSLFSTVIILLDNAITNKTFYCDIHCAGIIYNNK